MSAYDFTEARKILRLCKAELDAKAELAAVRFDEYGTPDRRLPNCPRCEENELHVSAWSCSATCLLCGCRVEWKREVDA